MCVCVYPICINQPIIIIVKSCGGGRKKKLVPRVLFKRKKKIIINATPNSVLLFTSHDLFNIISTMERPSGETVKN